MKNVLLLIVLVSAFSNSYGQWKQTEGPYGSNIWCFAQSPTHLYAGTLGYGVFASTDMGMNWTDISGGQIGMVIYEMAIFQSALYIATNQGLFSTKDHGLTWTHELSDLVYTVFVAYDKLYVGTQPGIMISTDGLEWKQVNDGLDHTVRNLTKVGNTLFAGTYQNGIFASTDEGETWTPVSNGLTTTVVYRVVGNESDLYAGTDAGVFHSTDQGANWNYLNTPPMPEYGYVYDFALLGNKLFVSTGAHGIFSSTDKGTTWQTANSGLASRCVSKLFVQENNLFAGSVIGVSYSTDLGTSWTDRNHGMNGLAGQAITANGNDLYIAATSSIYRSTDNAKTWETLPPFGDFEPSYMNALMFHDKYFYAADASNGVFRSSDQGAIWEQVVDGLTSNKVWCLGQMGPTILAGAWQRFVHRSTDNGMNWEYASKNMTGGGCTDFETMGGRLFAGVSGTPSGGGVYVSVDTGRNWYRVLTESIWDMTVLGDKLIVGSSVNGIFITSDFGETWTESLGTIQISKLVTFGNGKLLAATIDGMFLSRDTGKTWINVSEGLFDPFSAYTMEEGGGYIYVGTDYGTWRRSIGELEAAAVNGQKTVLLEVSPNPTSGKCTIDGVPEDVYAVSVLNCLGQTVLSQTHLEGRSITLDLSDVPAGSYIVCMKSDTAVIPRVIVKQ